MKQQEFSFFDNTQIRLSSDNPPSTPIIIVGITEQDLQNLAVSIPDD